MRRPPYLPARGRLTAGFRRAKCDQSQSSFCAFAFGLHLLKRECFQFVALHRSMAKLAKSERISAKRAQCFFQAAERGSDLKDFAPITQLATVENVLVISAQSPIRTLKELIALGRSKAAHLSYATPGAGSLAHLAAELLPR